jgi:hypothetical protein
VWGLGLRFCRRCGLMLGLEDRPSSRPAPVRPGWETALLVLACGVLLMFVVGACNALMG